MTDTEVLGVGDFFEGKEIVGVGIEIPGVAGGLRDAMKFGPVAFGEGERFCLVLTGVCQKVRFDPADKKHPAGDQTRVQILDAQEGVFIDEAAVTETLRRQRDLIEEGRRREEAAKGVHQLPLADGEPTEDDERAALGREAREDAVALADVANGDVEAYDKLTVPQIGAALEHVEELSTVFACQEHELAQGSRKGVLKALQARADELTESLD